MEHIVPSPRARTYVRRGLIALAVLTGLAITSMLVMASTWPTLNRVETGKSLAYPELRPHNYQLGYDRVYDEALAATKEQEGWAVLSEDRSTGRITAEALMPITGWKQQLTMDVTKRSSFVSRVSMISEGQDAPGDLGQNARNIEAWFASLDHRLGAARVGK